MSQKCHQSVTKFRQDRWSANLARRWHGDYTTYTIYIEAPSYEAIKNGTCVLTPEGISGPYVYPSEVETRYDGESARSSFVVRYWCH